MVNKSIKIVFGGAAFNSSSSFPTLDKVEEALNVLEEEGVKVIDTAQVYGNSEELLGQTKAASRFVIDTKDVGGTLPGQSTKEKVVERGLESLKKLETDSVDILYIHAPDYETPFEDTLAGINELHKAGKFKRFGLSNFSADDVDEVVRIAKKNDWVLPTVYQGNYSAVGRKQETVMFPTLRKHNMAFYAYSPMAGGFLAKTREQLTTSAQGRWDPDSFLGKLYGAMYMKPAMLDGLDQWNQIAEDSGISRAELAYRWVAYNSHLQGDLGDGIIIGASSLAQLKQTVAGLRNGPLSEEVVKKIDAVWDTVAHESVLDNFGGFKALQEKGEGPR